VTCAACHGPAYCIERLGHAHDIGVALVSPPPMVPRPGSRQRGAALSGSGARRRGEGCVSGVSRCESLGMVGVGKLEGQCSSRVYASPASVQGARITMHALFELSKVSPSGDVLSGDGAGHDRAMYNALDCHIAIRMPSHVSVSSYGIPRDARDAYMAERGAVVHARHRGHTCSKQSIDNTSIREPLFSIMKQAHA